MRAVCGGCMNRCSLEEGQTGMCRARKNTGGAVIPVNYGKITSMALDPIEKKPLRRFLPGSVILSVGSFGCNLRCPFCHNALLVTRLAETPEIPEQEVLDFLASRRGLLDGVVLTGGEPLLQPDAADFLRKVRELGFAVKLDTNGCDPARLAEILNQGLVDYVAMDVKNAPARYAETVGIPGFNPAPVEESIRLLRKSTVDYEFRTTLVRELHRPEDLDAIAAWLAGAPRYYLQNFVDSGNLIGRGYHGFTAEQLQGFAERVRPFFGAVELRGID